MHTIFKYITLLLSLLIMTLNQPVIASDSHTAGVHKRIERIHIQSLSPHHRALQLQQISFAPPIGDYEHTDWGQIVIKPKTITQGYVNMLVCKERTVSTQIGHCFWVVQNFYIPATWQFIRGTLKKHRLEQRMRLLHSPLLRRSPPDFDEFRLQALTLTKYFDLRPWIDANNKKTNIIPITQLHGIIVKSNVPLKTRRQFMHLLANNRISIQTYAVETTTLNQAGYLGNDAGGSAVPPNGSGIPIPAANYIDQLGAPPAPPPEPFPAPGPPSTLINPIEFYQAATFNQHAAFNQCGPIAVANTFRYLNDTWPRWPIAFPHLKGYAKVPEDNDPKKEIYDPHTFDDVPCSNPDSGACPLVSVIDAFTRREEVQNYNSGNGSSVCQWVRGALGFVVNLKAQGIIPEAIAVSDFLRARHQGSSNVLGGAGDACDFAILRHPVTDEGLIQSIPDPNNSTTVTTDWILEQLSNNRGLVCGHGRYDKLTPISGPNKRERDGGHIYRIWGYHEISAGNSPPQISVYLLDDIEQGSFFLKQTTGLDTRSVKLQDTNSDGQLNLDDSNSELEFCISFEPIPLPPIIGPPI